jgi:hypothetical protein
VEGLGGRDEISMCGRNIHGVDKVQQLKHRVVSKESAARCRGLNGRLQVLLHDCVEGGNGDSGNERLETVRAEMQLTQTA